MSHVNLTCFSGWVLGEIRSVAQSCPTLCDPVNRSTPGLPVHHQLPEFTETHVHRVSDTIQPSHPLSSPSINRLYLLAISWLLTRFPHEYAIPILPVLPARPVPCIYSYSSHCFNRFICCSLGHWLKLWLTSYEFVGDLLPQPLLPFNLVFALVNASGLPVAVSDTHMHSFTPKFDETAIVRNDLLTCTESDMVM